MLTRAAGRMRIECSRDSDAVSLSLKGWNEAVGSETWWIERRELYDLQYIVGRLIQEIEEGRRKSA